MSAIAILNREIESLIHRYGASEFDEEVSAARDGYCDRRGRVFEEEEAWENFTRGFLEWYVVERPWKGESLSPAALVAAECSDGERKLALHALATSQRVLARVQSMGKKGLEVVDLVGGAHFLVKEKRQLTGMQVGNVVEMRVIGFQEEVMLGRSFLFHPEGTQDAIASAALAMLEAGKSRSEVIDHIALLRFRAESYQHVSAIRIYEDPSIVAGASS